MKTYCKHVDPSDIGTIERFTWECISRKLRRKDYSLFVAQYCEISAKNIRRLARSGDNVFQTLQGALRAISLDVQARILARDLRLDPVRYEERYDGLSGKTRVIGIESIMQQIMEHIAVGCLSELWEKKYEYHQYASIKGKGQLRGAKMLQRWTKSGKTKYFVKLDVRKCFQSLTRQVCMRWLRRDIGKNELLLWFADALLQNHGVGLIIGSLLSQFLCNYLLSYAYRYAVGLSKTRRGKRIRLVSCALFYMDDILLTGIDRRNLVMAVRKLGQYMRQSFGLQIKPAWNIRRHKDCGIDMMGYVVTCSGRLKIRRRIFLRARRAFVRANRAGDPGVKICRRVSAYFGYFKHTRIRTLKTKDRRAINTHGVNKKVSEIISLHDRRIELCAA